MVVVGGGGVLVEGESLFSVLYNQSECYQQSKIRTGNDIFQHFAQDVLVPRA